MTSSTVMNPYTVGMYVVVFTLVHAHHTSFEKKTQWQLTIVDTRILTRNVRSQSIHAANMVAIPNNKPRIFGMTSNVCCWALH